MEILTKWREPMMKKLFACLLMLTLCMFALTAQAETLTVMQTVQPTVELPGSSEELFAYYVEQELYKLSEILYRQNGGDAGNMGGGAQGGDYPDADFVPDADNN